MMSVLKDIFAEYVNKRNKGFEAPEALNILKGYIRKLPKEERQQLAALIRKWEHKNHMRHAPVYAADTEELRNQTVETPSVDPTRTQTMPSVNRDALDERIKQQQQKKQTKTDDVPRVKQNPPPQKRTTSTVRVLQSLNPFSSEPKEKPTPAYQEKKRVCPTCHYANKADAVICYSCGTMMGIIGTRQFDGEMDDDFAFHHYTPESALILKLRDTQYEFEMQPQKVDRDLVVGRSAEGSQMMPDVDLLDFDGERLGVSRLHLGVKYIKDERSIQIYDMGSSNGTYLNGQRLHPREVRLLRNGDELRLGRLVMRAVFRHSTSGSS